MNLWTWKSALSATVRQSVRSFTASRTLLILRTGGLCGSTFLDVAFAKYIETLVGVSQYQGIKESNRKRMMRDFEFGIKRCFSGIKDPVFSVDLVGVKDDPKNGIIDDTITLKP